MTAPGVLDLRPGPAALAIVTGGMGPLVDAVFDGRRVTIAISINNDEHRRRSSSATGSLTDRRALHALWTLPEDLPVPAHALASPDRDALLKLEGTFVDRQADCLVRTYRPAVSVDACIAWSATPEAAVRRLTHLPPIYRRVAVARTATRRSIELARRRRIGLATFQGHALKVHVDPSQPVVGAPAVYRWWLAELAYDAWLTPTVPTGEVAPWAR